MKVIIYGSDICGDCLDTKGLSERNTQTVPSSIFTFDITKIDCQSETLSEAP